MYDDGKECEMADTLTLDLPPEVARRARAVAAATNRPVEEVVVGWIGRAAAEESVELLSDAEVLELARAKMSDPDQAAMSELLGRQTELNRDEQDRLDGLLATYRRGLVLKARAVKEAVSRGLMARLDGHAA
jgi:hypothetical protein